MFLPIVRFWRFVARGLDSSKLENTNRDAAGQASDKAVA
jgi:hypothetical protein